MEIQLETVEIDQTAALQRAKGPVVLSECTWQGAERAHIDCLEGFVETHLARRHRSEKHPVHDFLFEYFNFRPAALMRWSPGVHRYLEGVSAERFLERKEFSSGDSGVGLYPSTFPEKRVRATEWILGLQRAIERRPPFLGCMGLHEWAMVLEEQDVRHPQFSLRMPHADLVEFVRQQPIRCTHFDAFRFFFGLRETVEFISAWSG